VFSFVLKSLIKDGKKVLNRRNRKEIQIAMEKKKKSAMFDYGTISKE